MSEQGSPRYPRTFGGLIASMIVLVVIVVPLVLVTHLWSDARRTTDGVAPITPAVQYREIVKEVQQSGQTLVYPPKLPAGWRATSADWDITTDPTRPQWRLGILTADQQFVGLYEQDAPVESLVTATIDKDAKQGEGATIATDVGDRWSTWTDTGGDVGYAISVGRRTLVVYGTSDSDVRTLMALLTNRVLPGARSTQS